MRNRKVNTKLVRRLLHALERGFNWTDLEAQNGEDKNAVRDRKTITKAIKAAEEALRQNEKVV